MMGYLQTRMSRIGRATRYSGRFGNQGSVRQRSARRPDTQADHGAEGVASRGGSGRSRNRCTSGWRTALSPLCSRVRRASVARYGSPAHGHMIDNLITFLIISWRDIPGRWREFATSCRKISSGLPGFRPHLRHIIITIFQDVRFPHFVHRHRGEPTPPTGLRIDPTGRRPLWRSYRWLALIISLHATRR